ncbi:glutamate synthase 1 [NADH], chloroplastic-like [Selaginella moellendorffii]|uniref:glutamate synthase 1 [NADH], chloroplastic-like n=1 Tax=Selaginella moellendorffii TaxID=88036 RepID=UPI000D1CB1FB|nr:glutamate synthase 1 [NADH], chloroplastic-like [Selaginella moellendorffii]|eukprot:XP_024516133.1 glutamate synthase 1 [NADH], chloroplastic-like [Selaginella moellendorffii]
MARLAAADQLSKAGHSVTVFERVDRIGGLMMYGVPNMKTDKVEVVHQRVNLMAAAGIEFIVNANVGVDKLFSVERDLKVEGREYDGIRFAMEFLHTNTKSLLDLAQGQQLHICQRQESGGDRRRPYRHRLHRYCGPPRLHERCKSGATSSASCNSCTGESMATGKSFLSFRLCVGGSRLLQWPQIFHVDYGPAEAKEKFGSDPRSFSPAASCKHVSKR